MIQSEYWMLLTSRVRSQSKLYRSEVAARKTANERPCYYSPSKMHPIGGGQLWRLTDGHQWVLVENIIGEYNKENKSWS